MTSTRQIKLNTTGKSLNMVQGMFVGRNGKNIKNLSSKFPNFNIQLNKDVINISPKGRQQRHKIYNGTLSFRYVTGEIDKILSQLQEKLGKII